MSTKRKRAKAPPSPPQPQPAAPKDPPPACPYDGFFFAVLAIAAAVRVAFLNRQELWQDEIGFVVLAQTSRSLRDIWLQGWDMVVTIGQLPLSFMIFNAFYRILELFTVKVSAFTPGLARIPAVLFGLLGVWSVYRLSARVLDLATARLAALVMALFFFPVYYSREAYCYAQIMALTPLALWLGLRMFVDADRSPVHGVWLFVCLTAVLYSHLGALFFVLSMSAYLLVLWIWSRTRRDTKTARGAFLTGVICALALLAISPFLVRFALHNRAHTAGSPYSVATILNDGVSKLFLGERPWGSAVSWLVLVAGMVSLLAPHEGSQARRPLAVIASAGLLALAYATHRSQYLSARYFSPVAPLLLIIMAQGVRQISIWLARLLRLRESYRTPLFAALAAAPLAIHGLVYVPALLALTEKSVSFASAARWINETLPPGTPYLMESAYEIRYVGGAFPTPNNPPAAPYVHGAGAQEMERLHQRQMDFMTRFPEAPFIESAHHGVETAAGIWSWPHRHFRRRVTVSDPERLKRLIRTGIYPVEPHPSLSEYSYRVDIYFNTWEDRVELARAAGQQTLFAFDDWLFSGQTISPQETQYFRLQRGHSGAFRVVNIGSEPIRGSVRLTMAAPGPAGSVVTLQFLLNGQPLWHTRVPTGQMTVVDVPVDELRPGDNMIGWQRSAGWNLGEGFVIVDATWEPSSPQAEE